MNEASLEDNFYDIEESQQSLANLNNIYQNDNDYEIKPDKSEIPRSEKVYIDLIRELNKTKNITPKNIKDVQPFFVSDINYDENSDVDIISSASSNSNYYFNEDENKNSNERDRAYFESEVNHFDNYTYYTKSYENGDESHSDLDNKNGRFREKINKMIHESNNDTNTNNNNNDESLNLPRNKQSSNHRSHHINKFKMKKKNLKKNYKKKYSLWTKKYNSVYMEEKRKGLNEDFYSSSCSSLDSEDYASARESLEALKYLDNLSIEELRNLTTMDIDTLKENSKSEEHALLNSGNVEVEERDKRNVEEESKNEEEIFKKEEIEIEKESRKDDEVEMEEKNKDNLNPEEEKMNDQNSISSNDSSANSASELINQYENDTEQHVYVSLKDDDNNALRLSRRSRCLSNNEVDNYNENKVNIDLNRAASTTFIDNKEKTYNLDENDNSKESNEKKNNDQFNNNEIDKSKDKTSSKSLQKCSSEFFEPKKKKRWSSIFSSNKEKLRNSSSQILLTNTEKEKVDSLELKDQEKFIYNNPADQNTSGYTSEDLPTYNAFEGCSDSSSNFNVSITTGNTSKSSSILRKFKLGKKKKPNMIINETLNEDEGESVSTSPTKYHVKDRESITSIETVQSPILNDTDSNVNSSSSSHQYVKVHSKNKLQKEFTQLKLIQEFDSGMYPDYNRDEYFMTTSMITTMTEEPNNIGMNTGTSIASTISSSGSIRSGKHKNSFKQKVLRKPNENQFGTTSTTGNSIYSVDEKGNHGPVWALAFSFDGQYLAAGGQDGILRVWRLLNNKSLESISSPTSSLSSPCNENYQFNKKDSSKTGNNTVIIEEHQETEVPDNDNDEKVIDNKDNENESSSPTTAFPTVKQTEEIANNTNEDNKTFTEIPEICEMHHKNSIASKTSTMSSTSNTTANNNHQFSPIFENKPYRIYIGHSSDILDIAWSKNNYIISSSIDKTVRLWHISHMTCLCLFQHQDFVTSIKFHPIDDRYILTGCMDSKLRLWSIEEKKLIYWNEVSEKQMITAVGFTRDGSMAMAGTYIGNVLFYELEGLKYNTQITVKSNNSKGTKGKKITGIESFPRISSGDDKILITSNDSRIRMYQLLDKSLYSKYKGHTNRNCQIKANFSEDGRYIICGSEDKQVFIWNTNIYQNQLQSNSFEFFLASDDIVTATVFAPRRTRVLLECEGLRSSKISTFDSNILKKMKNYKKARIVENVTTTIGTGDKRQGSLNSASGMIFAVADVKGKIRIFENEILPSNNTEQSTKSVKNLL